MKTCECKNYVCTGRLLNTKCRQVKIKGENKQQTEKIIKKTVLYEKWENSFKPSSPDSPHSTDI
jgi:hypothetical protein